VGFELYAKRLALRLHRLPRRQHRSWRARLTATSRAGHGRDQRERNIAVEADRFDHHGKAVGDIARRPRR